MASGISSFLNINGYDMPPVRVGFEWVLSDVVDAGRNLNATVIGQRVGRQLYKLQNISWVGLSPETRRMILAALEPYFVPVTFEDYRTGLPITITMYPGDRTGKPLFADKITHMVTKDETLSFNLIDAGRPLK